MQDNNFQRLFEPLAIGHKLTLSNRLIMAPMTTTSGEEDGRFSTQEIAYLARRAAAGIGLVITPACYCHKSGHAFERQVGCHADAMLERMSACAQSINTTGAKSFLQVHHGGNAARQIYSGEPPWAPSAVVNRRGTSELPKEMDSNDIEVVIEAFVRASRLARQAGFSGVELHGANTYLFQQFFSPLTNRRSDEWGAHTMDDRCRFALAVVTRVREAVGEDYPLAYRLSPEEPDPEGYSTYDAIELARRLVEAGIDIIHVSSWEYGVGLRNDYPPDSHPTLEFRRALPQTVPVIGVGGITTPKDAVRVLEDGVDLVALGRALLLDADWADKVRKERSADISRSASSRADIDALEIPDRMKDYVARFFLPD